MKKKNLMLLVLAMCAAFVLAGCSDTEETAPTDGDTPAVEEETPNNPVPEAPVPPITVSPLPVSIDLEQLDDCTLSVSLQKGDAYLDDSGIMQMKVTVYTYDLYDMTDIARLQVGDSIVRGGKTVEITDLEQGDGYVVINGDLENGGFALKTDGDTVYYENGFNDAKAYYALGEATIRVSDEFLYTDASDLENKPTVYYPGDFLTDYVEIDYNFTPYNTSIVVEDGVVISMERHFVP